ncbi:UvrD-helicase domain-containing protein [Dactylosporangium sp. CA-139114]|uniref:UvrD-helicase domain-containing protein n=1 Tax=Dactylosporangium sp. CA-139114 TaxID=3239931 RepID=UPI003D957704
MAELAIDAEFLRRYARLERSVQHGVDAAIRKFAEHTHAGLHLEKLAGARDPNVRTIRISRFWRGIVVALGGARYLLKDVLPHDDANAYAISRTFTVNQALGVLEVRDQAGIEEFARTLPDDAAAGGTFDGTSTADLKRLGIDPELIPLVRRVNGDQQVEALCRLLPDVQATVLTGLASGMSPAEVGAELAEQILAGQDAGDIDPDDLTAAARRTPDRIMFVSGPVELATILARPFDLWRVFLHPLQRAVAYRAHYSGPALITGSAGTGKTVTGVHRATFLAGRLPDTGSKVLLTTFTRALAGALDRQLYRLTDDPAVRSRIDVISIDKLAYDIVASTRKVKVAGEDVLDPLWAEAAAGRTYVNRAGRVTKYSAAFLRREWEQVILARGLTDVEAYLGTVRSGRGDTLRAPQRTQVWAAIQHAVEQLARRGLRTHLQLADEAADIVTRTPRSYRHVVVDEAQDLHPAQWRLLRALVPPGPDDLFLLADPYQRIYDNRVSLAQLGIQTRGRSHRLTVNYRTTREILGYAVDILNGQTVVGLDDEDDTLRGYHAVTRGSAPTLTAHTDRDGELDALIERVGTWIDQGVEPHAIGVAARTNSLVATITKVLQEAYIDVADDRRGTDGVCVATMHRMKGLEFQCLAVVGLDATVLPALTAVTPRAEDAQAHEQDLQRERCLLFVAMTRARDVVYLSHSGAPSTLLPALAGAEE